MGLAEVVDAGHPSHLQVAGYTEDRVPCSFHLGVAFDRVERGEAVGWAACRGTIGMSPYAPSSWGGHSSWMVRWTCPQGDMQGRGYHRTGREDPAGALADKPGENWYHRESRPLPDPFGKEGWKSQHHTQSRLDRTVWDN